MSKKCLSVRTSEHERHTNLENPVSDISKCLHCEKQIIKSAYILYKAKIQTALKVKEACDTWYSH